MGLGWGVYKEQIVELIPLSIFLVVWKEKNLRAFEGIEKEFNVIRDNWIYSFAFMLLGHDIKGHEDVGAVFDILIDL